MALLSLLLAFPVVLGLAFVPWKAWPHLAKTLYLRPRRPDPSAGPLARRLYIGPLPPMTVWIANTVLVGTLSGALLVAVAKPGRRA